MTGTSERFSPMAELAVMVGVFLGQMLVSTANTTAWSLENTTTPCRDIRVETSRESVEVTWSLPEFDVTSEAHQVTSRCDRAPGDRFFWGTVRVRCWAEGYNGTGAECRFTVTVRPSMCPMWSPPKNGALACDRWLFGQFCMVFCNQEFEFDSQPAHLYICGASGLWTSTATSSRGSPRWPDCLELRNPELSHKGLTKQYFTGDISAEEENATAPVQRKFVDVFEGTVFGEQGGCAGNSDCVPENVAVFWGSDVDVTPAPTTLSPMSTPPMQNSTSDIRKTGPIQLTTESIVALAVGGLAALLLMFGIYRVAEYCRRRSRGRRKPEAKPTEQELKVMLS